MSISGKVKRYRFLIPTAAAFIAVTAVVVVMLIRSDAEKKFMPTLPSDTVLTEEQAFADFDFIYRTISENHPCFLDGSGLDKELTAEYERQRVMLSDNPEITVRDLWRSASAMCHVLGDAHTIVTVASDLYAEDQILLENGKVLSVNGVPCAELLEDFRGIFSYEPQMEFYAEYMLGRVIRRKFYLELLGIDTSDGADYEIEFDGTVVTEHYEFVPGSEVRGVMESAELCSYTVDKENSIGIFTLNECVVNDEYKNALNEFFGKVKEDGIETVAVDLRKNGGGNSLVINEFLKYIDVDEYTIFGGTDVRIGKILKKNTGESKKNKKKDNAFDGELYALTSNYTFSSGMNFAVAVADNNIGKIIGETPGNMPAHYGDKLSFQCPNSGLIVSVSYKKFHRADSAKDDQPLVPDIAVEAENAIGALYDIAAKGE